MNKITKNKSKNHNVSLGEIDILQVYFAVFITHMVKTNARSVQ